MKIFAPEEVQSVYRSLALENLWLGHPAGEAGLLFCWCGEASVVMGKHQNPWRECRLAYIREQGLPLARRVSGGGTVYHDPGNLNISWILPREKYRAEEMHGLLIRSLKSLGVPAEAGAGGSLVAAGKKISGSAFCYRKDRVLHHGTLLLNADLEKLSMALSAPELEMQTHAVDSVRASVMNLRARDPELTRRKVTGALIREAEKIFGKVEALAEGDLPEHLEEETARLASADWIWNQTPGFRSILKWPDGRELRFRVHKGKMTECQSGDLEIELKGGVPFPDGDFGRLELQLGWEKGSIPLKMAEAGWIKF